MGLVQGIAGFTMSAAVAAAGAGAIHEWSHGWDEYYKHKACATQPYAGSQACKDVIASKDLFQHQKDTNHVWGLIGIVALTGSGLGAVGSYAVILRAAVPEAPPNAYLEEFLEVAD
jgi:hypothetical protein